MTVTVLVLSSVYAHTLHGLPHLFQPCSSLCVALFNLFDLATGNSLVVRKILMIFLGCLYAGICGEKKVQPSGVHLKEGFCGVFGVPYFLEVDADIIKWGNYSVFGHSFIQLSSGLPFP